MQREWPVEAKHYYWNSCTSACMATSTSWYPLLKPPAWVKGQRSECCLHPCKPAPALHAQTIQSSPQIGKEDESCLRNRPCGSFAALLTFSIACQLTLGLLQRQAPTRRQAAPVVALGATLPLSNLICVILCELHCSFVSTCFLLALVKTSFA